MPTRYDAERRIKAPTGTDLTCRSWLTEAPMRMLMNNLDAEVAEKPAELVVYGGIGRAARNWECYDKIVETLQRLKRDETLLVQSGKPVGVFRTSVNAPRVLIANSNLVPHWATWEHFNELDRAGLMMYGQMTAGSWIYIGTQGIIQGTYETFVAAGKKHYGGDLSGKWFLTGGLGGMGGAQPLACTMAGASMLAVECDPARIERRLEMGFIDEMETDLDRALAKIEASCKARSPLSIGLLGNAGEVFPELARRGVRPDAVTDQTSAHDPLNGYLPVGWTLEQAADLRETHPDRVIAAARSSIALQVRAMLEFHYRKVPVFDYGNNIRQVAYDAGRPAGVCLPRLRPGLHPPALLPRDRPLPLGGAERRSRGHLQDGRQGQGADARRRTPAPLARHGARAHPFPGAARADLLGGVGRPGAAGRRVQRDGGERRTQGARRDRPRSPRFGVRGQPQPRDRGYARTARTPSPIGRC